jgi:LacI family transcriptional regulator
LTSEGALRAVDPTLRPQLGGSPCPTRVDWVHSDDAVIVNDRARKRQGRLRGGDVNLAKVTLADVALRAQVSVMTVSRVVNARSGVSHATRARVREAIATLGYRPNIVARGLKRHRSGTIGLIVPDVTNPYFPAIVRGAEDVASRHGYTLLLTNVIEDPQREIAALQAFEDRRVDGVIVCSPRLPSPQLDALLRRHHAAVVVNRRTRPDVAGSVRLDHENGMREAMEHVLAGGAKRLAVLAGPPQAHAGRERLLGIDRATREHGVDLPDERVRPCPPTVEGGETAALALLSADPTIDTLLCFNDLVAAGALRALARLGRRVPDDVSVVGCDDIPFASMFHPSLTTLRSATYDMGAHAADMLQERMAGRGRGVDIVIQPELIVRASTRPVAGDRAEAEDRDATPRTP